MEGQKKEAIIHSLGQAFLGNLTKQTKEPYVVMKEIRLSGFSNLALLPRKLLVGDPMGIKCQCPFNVPPMGLSVSQGLALCPKAESKSVFAG